MAMMQDHISDEDRQRLEQLAEQQRVAQEAQKKPDRTKRLNQVKASMKRGGQKPDDGRLYLRATRDAADLLMVGLVQRVGEKAQWLDEYDDIAQWMTGNAGRGLMLIGDCGRGKSVITTEILPDLLERGFLTDAATGMQLAGPFICTAKELRQRYKEALQHRIIVIDDVGTESVVNNFGEKTDYFSDLVMDVDRPYRDSTGAMRRRLLICSTNLNRWELFGGDRIDWPVKGQTTHYDGRYPDLRVQDRLRSMTKRIWLKGPSLR